MRSFNLITFDKSSKVLSGRNPFRKDEDIIDYEMDSEEEFAEENGEDIEGNLDDEDEEMQQDEENDSDEDKFIVSDGHLSVCDISLDGSESEKIAEIERRR